MGFAVPTLAACFQMWSPHTPVTGVPSPRDAGQRAGPDPSPLLPSPPSSPQRLGAAHHAGPVLGGGLLFSAGSRGWDLELGACPVYTRLWEGP